MLNLQGHSSPILQEVADAGEADAAFVADIQDKTVTSIADHKVFSDC